MQQRSLSDLRRGGCPLGEPMPVDGGDHVQLGPVGAGDLLAEDRHRGALMLVPLGGRRDLGWLSQWLSHVMPKFGYDVQKRGGRYKI